MRCRSYNFGLIVVVMFGNFAKLDSPRRLVQFWQNFQTSHVLLIPNCTHNPMITHTNIACTAQVVNLLETPGSVHLSSKQCDHICNFFIKPAYFWSDTPYCSSCCNYLKQGVCLNAFNRIW